MKRTLHFIFELQIAFSVILYWIMGTTQWLDSHILYSVPFCVSSTHLAPHTVITVVLTVFPVLYLHPCDYCNYPFVLLNPSPFLSSIPRKHFIHLRVSTWQYTLIANSSISIIVYSLRDIFEGILGQIILVFWCPQVCYF